jgi:hypothetical protein
MNVYAMEGDPRELWMLWPNDTATTMTMTSAQLEVPFFG